MKKIETGEGTEFIQKMLTDKDLEVSTAKVRVTEMKRKAEKAQNDVQEAIAESENFEIVKAQKEKEEAELKAQIQKLEKELQNSGQLEQQKAELDEAKRNL